MSVSRGPEVENRRARLGLHVPGGDGPVDGVVLVLHGGRSTSTAPTSPLQLAVLRMLPFAPAVSRAAHEAGLRVAVARLRHRVRGWNGARQDPVADAGWALDVLRDRFPGVPLVLLGHSMGGRTALALAGAPDVVGVVGLAPWVEPGDGIGDVAGRRIEILHGTADRMTDPRASRAWAGAARRQGAIADHRAVEGAGHTMLQRPAWWHRSAADAAIRQLRAAHPTGGRRAAPTGQDVSGFDGAGLGTNDLRSTTGSRRQS